MALRPADDPRTPGRKDSPVRSSGSTAGGRTTGRTEPPINTPVTQPPPPSRTRASGPREPTVRSTTGPTLIPDDYLFELYDPNSDEWGQYTYAQLVEAGYLQPNMLLRDAYHVVSLAQKLVDEEYENKSPSGGRRSGGRGGGGGGGAIGQPYVAPDRRLVTEYVRSTMASLMGRVDKQFLDTLVNLYMSEDKKAFGLQETQTLDPRESVKAKIRTTAEYKAIHNLRPESVDEMEWITTRTGALKRAGVTDVMAERLGIAQATAGANEQEAVTAGNIATFDQSGKLLDDLKNRVRTASYSALRLV